MHGHRPKQIQLTWGLLLSNIFPRPQPKLFFFRLRYHHFCPDGPALRTHKYDGLSFTSLSTYSKCRPSNMGNSDLTIQQRPTNELHVPKKTLFLPAQHGVWLCTVDRSEVGIFILRSLQQLQHIQCNEAAAMFH